MVENKSTPKNYSWNPQNRNLRVRCEMVEMEMFELENKKALKKVLESV